jgi:hypothetical protein
VEFACIPLSLSLEFVLLLLPAAKHPAMDVITMTSPTAICSVVTELALKKADSRKEAAKT